jgi:hypothetical protein
MANKERETEFQGLIKDVKGRHSKRMNALLTSLDDEDFSVAYFKVLEYATPKLQRQELTGSVEVNKVTIERVVIGKDDIENG